MTEENVTCSRNRLNLHPSSTRFEFSITILG
jgi:hypothetical protein